jgi:hypothetical protein
MASFDENGRHAVPAVLDLVAVDRPMPANAPAVLSLDFLLPPNYLRAITAVPDGFQQILEQVFKARRSLNDGSQRRRGGFLDRILPVFADNLPPSVDGRHGSLLQERANVAIPAHGQGVFWLLA